MLMLKVLLHSADIGNSIRPFKVSKGGGGPIQSEIAQIIAIAFHHRWFARAGWLACSGDPKGHPLPSHLHRPSSRCLPRVCNQ